MCGASRINVASTVRAMGTVQAIDAGRVERRPQIGLVASAEGEAELLRLAGAYRRILSACDVVAPYEVGRMLVEQLGLIVDCVGPVARGGAIQIASRVVGGSIHAVVAVRGLAQYNDPFLVALSRSCDLNDVAFAGNKATAEVLLRALGRPGARDMRSNHPSVRSDGTFPWDSPLSPSPFHKVRS